MSPSPGEITHVSDTALMVAACRALEAQIPDGFIHDPFAARLAGERGMAMLQGLPQPDMMRFGVAVRSRFLDELLLEALASHPIATVLCVGCGLDTRPWRLELPPALRWIEVDFADMLDYKDALMADEAPRCRRERVTADVTDPAQRHAIFAATGAAPALMITEGLLMYLPAAAVQAISAEAPEHSGIAHWIADITTTTFAKAINIAIPQSVRDLQASDYLHGEQIVDEVGHHGWTTASRRSYITDMAFAMPRIQRMRGDRPAPDAPPPIPPDDPTGVIVFSHA
jgi:methyltransferase (TIGR00027 family)